MKVKMWKNLWIPTTPAKPAIPLAPALHPNMRAIDLINQVLKDLEDYVKPDDIPFIRNLAISSIHHYDTFYENYTRNG